MAPRILHSAQPLEAHKSGLAAFRCELPIHLRLLLTYFLLAWFLYGVYETVRWIVAYYVPVPIADYWRVAAALRDYQDMHVAVLWRQHNEHRIVFPELVFAFDMLAAHGRLILPSVVSFVCYSLAWGILSYTVMADGELAFSVRSLAVLLSGVVAFWDGSALVFAQPFLLQWPLTQLAAALSLFSLKKAADTSDTRHLTVAIAAAVVATFSSGNALLLWPLLLAIGFFVRLSRRFMAALGLSAVLFIGLYFVGYRFTLDTDLHSLFLHPGYVAGFVGSYLGMPFGGITPAALGITAGLLNLTLFCALIAVAKRFGLLRMSPLIVLGGFYLFTILTVFITLSGRMNLSDPNFGAAKVSRYLAVPLLTWADLILLCLWMSARLQWRILTTRTLAVVFSLLLMWGFYKLKPWRQASSEEFANYQFAAMSLELDLVDAQIESRLFPMPEFIAACLPGLKENKLAVFFNGNAKWLGQSVAQFSAVQAASVAGEIVYSYPVEHGVEVVGWVDSIDTRDPLPRILLANESGKIVGFGRQPRAGFPADLRTFRTPDKQSWVGFVNLRIPSRTVSAYLVARKGLRPINGAALLPAFQSASTDQVGPPLDGVLWQKDRTWIQDASPAKPDIGWQPSAPTFYSWNGRDEKAGQAVAGFAAPGNGCVVLPILHGPYIGSLSAELRDADSGTLLAQLPFRKRDALWTLWRVPLGPDTRRLRFVALDNAPNRGQWLAVSTPLQCK